ncbi:MAG: aminopeptidase P family protein [Mollicutes bacterium PWAP]|nr:aminopeptidase P family protein [Mollicutes bacterium PWAP]
MDRKKLDDFFVKHKADALISISPHTRHWFSEIITSDGFLFLEPQNGVSSVLLDGRYIEYGNKESKNVSVIHLNSLKNFIKDKKNKYKKILVESNYLTLSQKKLILSWFPDAELIEINGQYLRRTKTKNEIDFVRESCRISLQALENIKHEIKPGVSEKYIDAILEKELRILGADKSNFDAIIASGFRGAMPHARASDKIMQEGELVTVDFGALYNGWCADITRTFPVGKTADPKMEEIRKIVYEAQQMGIRAIKPGIKTGDIDKICRDFINEKGYGKYFVHGTGHGLGNEVHELPNVSQSPLFNTELMVGDIITVEPGIYIEGLGGVRFEDDILVTKDGFEILSGFDYL